MKKGSVKTIAACVLAILILVAAQIMAELVASLLLLLPWGGMVLAGDIAAAVLYPILTYFGLKLMTDKLSGISLSELRVKRFGLRPIWCAAAVLLPAGVVGVYLCLGGEWVALDASAIDKAELIVGGVCFYSIAAGIVEEMVFRGVVMGLLERQFHLKIAVLVPSVAFGLVHIIGNELSVPSMLQLVAAGTFVGIMFSLIELHSGNFWNNALVHALWNMSTVGLMHIGTEPYDAAVFTYVLRSKSMAVTGGDFGIEASVISIAGYIIVSALTLVLMKQKQRKI